MAEGGHCIRFDQTYSTDDWLTGYSSNTLVFGNIITSAPNERVLRTTQPAKLSFNHPSVVLTADVFLFFNKIPPPDNIFVLVGENSQVAIMIIYRIFA